MLLGDPASAAVLLTGLRAEDTPGWRGELVNQFLSHLRFRAFSPATCGAYLDEVGVGDGRQVEAQAHLVASALVAVRSHAAQTTLPPRGQVAG